MQELGLIKVMLDNYRQIHSKKSIAAEAYYFKAQLKHNEDAYMESNEVISIISEKFNFELSKLPFSIKILLENLIRNEDGELITKEMISDFCNKINSNEKIF